MSFKEILLCVSVFVAVCAFTAIKGDDDDES